MFDMSEAMKKQIDVLLKNDWEVIHYSGGVAYVARYSTDLIGIVREFHGGEDSISFCFTDVHRLRAVLELYDCEALSREA